MEEFKRALVTGWALFSIAIFAALAAAFAAPAETWKALPRCEAKLRGETCPACGMTTAFYKAAAGDIAGAKRENAASPYVLIAFSINTIASGIYAVRKTKMKYNDYRSKNKGE
ncbi:MAG: DUF2752 domain-containing protein [Chloroflexota bacterium]